MSAKSSDSQQTTALTDANNSAPDTSARPATAAAQKSKWRQIFSPGVLLLLVLTIVVLLGPVIAPHDPLRTDLNNVLAPPSAEHWFGTDQIGRDTFSRVLAGGQRTVGISLAALIVAVAVGTLIGLFAGIRGRRTDWAIMRIADSFMAFPEYVVAIVLTGLMGTGYWNLLLAIVVVKWVGVARLVRSIVLEQRSKPYITAARLSGVSTWQIMRRHLMPHVWGPLVAFATVDLGKIILLVASLSFLGLGVPRPAPEWGFMLNEGRGYISESTWIMLGPGLAILLFVLVSNIVGDRLADRLKAASASEPVADVNPAAQAVSVDATVDAAESKVVSVRDLKIFAGEHQLVAGMNLDIRPGEWVCIIGESGSGKSISSMSLAGLTSPSLQVKAEEICIAGTDYTQAIVNRQDSKLREVRGKQVAYVFQDYTQAFSPYFKIRTQLRETLDVSKAQADELIDAALAQVSLQPQHADRYPMELSGGQLQRMALASALLLRPQVLVCDEPTTALDAVTQAEVLEVIAQLRNELGCAVLFITHDLRTARKYADRLVVMRNGYLLETGATAAVIEKPQQTYTKQLFAAVPDIDNPVDRLPEVERA